LSRSVAPFFNWAFFNWAGPFLIGGGGSHF
jgi:hypothetical protein